MKHIFLLAFRAPWRGCWRAGMPAHIKSFLNVVERWGSKWQTLTLKASGATSEKIQLRYLFVMNGRNSHQFICSQPLVYLLPWQHTVALCTLQKWFANVLSLFPLPSLLLFIHFFLWHCYYFAFLPSFSQFTSLAPSAAAVQEVVILWYSGS